MYSFKIKHIDLGINCNGVRDRVIMSATISTKQNGEQVPTILVSNYKISSIYRIKWFFAHECIHLQELILDLEISEIRADILGLTYMTLEMWKDKNICDVTFSKNPYDTINKKEKSFYLLYRNNIMLNTINQVKFIMDFFAFEVQEKCSINHVIKPSM